MEEVDVQHAEAGIHAGVQGYNALTESFFNSFKNKRVHGARFETRADAIADAFDYIEPF